MGERVHLYSVNVRSSAGAATFQIQDGNTVVFPTGVLGVTAVLASLNWSTALTGTEGNNITITVGSAGAGNTTSVVVQADRF